MSFGENKHYSVNHTTSTLNIQFPNCRTSNVTRIHLNISTIYFFVKPPSSISPNKKFGQCNFLPHAND
jgi:hypothetical protein